MVDLLDVGLQCLSATAYTSMSEQILNRILIVYMLASVDGR